MDKLSSLSGVDLPFLMDFAMRNGVSAFTTLPALFANYTKAMSTKPIDYFAAGKLSG